MVLAALLVTAVPTPARADWNHDAGSPYGNFYNPTDSRPTGTSVVLDWSAQLPTGQGECLGGGVGGPLVAGGRVVVRTGHSIDAYAPSTGKLLWRARFSHWGPGVTDRERAGQLAVAGGRVLMVSTPCQDDADDPSYLTAMDERSGKRLWRRRLDPGANDLVVDKGVAVVSAGWGTGVSTTAFRVSDGRQRWRTRKGVSGQVSSLGRVFMGRANLAGGYVIDIATGRTLWSISGRAVWALAATPGLFIIRREGKLTAVHAASGKVVWSGLVYNAFTVSGSEMFVDREPMMAVYDLSTGRLRRTFPAKYGQPILAGGLIHQWNWIFDARTGAPYATVPGEGSYTHPVVWDGRIYFMETGEVLRSYVFR
ncbi:PQQ-binding-like beta-propeller repeat protein [Actinoplanes sp. NPDC051494]|uniref:outer membrane protein assembly factor BamB family protein n=1 Tax=Actinoplanes sp. NPDC051494 TaxID=3363907 RepID=UPI0037B7F9F3